MEDFSVRIDYKDKNLECIKRIDYSLEDYTEMLRFDILKNLMEIENMMYSQTGTKDKHEWNAEALETFNRIRHSLLDQANSIKRMPDNLLYKGVHCCKVSSGRAIADIINSI